MNLRSSNGYRDGNDEILQQQAEKLHVSATNEDIESRLTAMKAPFTAEDFQNHLHQQDMTVDALKQEIGRVQSREKLLNKEINSKISITDAEVADYYQAHVSEFNLPEEYFHLAKIVVNSDSDPSKSLKKLGTILDLLHSGEDFSVVAAKYSDDVETSTKGGEMGMIAESSLRTYPAIDAAIARLQSGQVTGVIAMQRNSSSPTHYVIVKLVETESAGQHELTDPRVQQTIRSSLRNTRSDLLTSAYMEILRNHAHVRNYFAEDYFNGSPSVR